jgi:hypothetical protein
MVIDLLTYFVILTTPCQDQLKGTLIKSKSIVTDEKYIFAELCT